MRNVERQNSIYSNHKVSTEFMHPGTQDILAPISRFISFKVRDFSIVLTELFFSVSLQVFWRLCYSAMKCDNPIIGDIPEAFRSLTKGRYRRLVINRLSISTSVIAAVNPTKQRRRSAATNASNAASYLRRSALFAAGDSSTNSSSTLTLSDARKN